MAYALSLHAMQPSGRKVVALAALNGIKVVTRGHGVPKSHPEMLALKEGHKVLEGSDPADVPAFSFGSTGPDPVFHKAAPAPFKSADPRFQAQVAMVRTLDRQEKAAKAWHDRDRKAKEPSLVDLIYSATPEKPGADADPSDGDRSVDVDFACMRMSSAMFGPGAASQGIVDEAGHVRPFKKAASSSKFFRVLEE